MKLVERTHSNGLDEQRDGAVEYWYDPMRPDVHFDKPGKSPFMDMELVPKYAAVARGAVVEVDPRMAQNLGMRTSEVVRGSLSQRVQAVGSITLDEHRLIALEARAAGWIERLHVRAVGDTVRAGDVVAEINSPELRTAFGELALAQQLGDTELTKAARARLALLGVTAPNVEAKGRFPVISPQSGVVTELMVREGAQVTPGVPLMKIADLGTVWVVTQVPEADAASIAAGATADVRTSGLPDQTFTGVVDYVYPQLDVQTRTARARIVIENPNGVLKPGMFAEVTVGARGATESILVPSEAVIRTGRRTVVIVAESEGRYRPVEVSVGRERDNQTEVREGLKPGERVVVSGQFLIDSEASLLGLYQRTADDSPAAQMRLMGEEGGPTVYGEPAEEKP
jgi:Cu(I)/Ag(I) efflux system membrane fusion protein